VNGCQPLPLLRNDFSLVIFESQTAKKRPEERIPMKKAISRRVKFCNAVMIEKTGGTATKTGRQNRKALVMFI